ncbi:MAG: aminopeptidase [Candidatus Omnitrophica bacterium]|nr:aminopeptidase [Candidatus Omnitrophota bacterium]
MNKDIVNAIIYKCLGYKKGERLLIVCDDGLRDLAYDFYVKTKAAGIESMLLQMNPRKIHGDEVPKAVAGAMNSVDIALLFTSVSMSHTKARNEACKIYGTRIASMPGITETVMRRAILIDYSRLYKKAKYISDLLTKGKRLEIYTARGTYLSMSISTRKGYMDNGLYIEKGAFGNLPAGEACVAPMEGTTNGRLVVDGSNPLTGMVKRPIEIQINNGFAEEIPIRAAKGLMGRLGKCVLNVAELGIGLNPKAKVTGNVLEDEKALNTAHIAFGNNISFGGKVDCRCHLDFVFNKPKIYIDGVMLPIN